MFTSTKMMCKHDGINAATEIGLQCQEERPGARRDKLAMMTPQVAMMSL
jgi:hypothetical protein